MLSLDGISRGVGDRTLFEGVWWKIHPGERAGLVGPNGCGKTTLLRILAGLDEPDAGAVSRRRGLRVAYLPQEVEAELDPSVSVLEAALRGADELRRLGRDIEQLAGRVADAAAAGDPRAAELADEYGQRRSLFEWFGGDSVETRARVILGGLGFARDEFSRPIGELSGGWRMRVLMARMLLSGADLLLLDEPTNHLDLDALAWLEGHLVASPAAVITVSHDRLFLDRVATHIADLAGGRLRVTRGGYAEWVRTRQAETERLRAEDRRLAAEEERLRRFVERFGYKASKASQANDRKRRLAEVRAERSRLVVDSAWSWSFRWPEPPPVPDLLVRLEGIGRGFGGTPVLREVDLHLRRGERLAVLGANGAGKTTLLRLLSGELLPDTGRRTAAPGLEIGRFAQHQLETMDPGSTVLEQARRAAPARKPEELRRALGAVGLGATHVDRLIGTLSGGERARLALARLLLQPAPLLMLDEPTNHLDLPMREALEASLRAWSGTLVVVSHDRSFLERLTQASLVVEDGTVRRLDGGWQQWLEMRRLAGSTSGGDRPAESPSETDGRSRAGRRARAEALQRRQARLRPVREEVARLEERITAAERRLAEVDVELADPARHQEGGAMRSLAQERARLTHRLEALGAEWEHRAAELERLELEEGGN